MLAFENANTPILNDAFFHYHPLIRFTAASLLHSDLITPGFSKMANTISKKLIVRGEEEAEQIRSSKDPAQLMKRLQPGTDNLNYDLLRDRLLEYEDEVTPALLEKLHHAEDDVLIEQGTRYLNQVSAFPLQAVTELAEKATDPYARSTYCVLLGVKGPESVLPVLWKQYYLLRNEYPLKSYMQGPLHGLYEYGCRFNMITP